MTHRVTTILGIMFALALYVAPVTAHAQSEGSKRITYFIDFTNYSEGAIDTWLANKGFQLEEDAKNPKKIDFDVRQSNFIINVKGPAFGLLINERVELQNYSKVRIRWGINEYPKGASYEKGVNNEALMLYIFFGSEKQASGSMFIPNSPYFIGLYLCENEATDTPYKGKYFHKSGRFVCLGKPKEGELVESEFELLKAFQAYYEKNETPVITGISLGFDTTSSSNKGKASAFVQSIEFFE